jgi:preprotein translocase subunit SecY
MFQSVANLFRVPELRKRIFITLVLLVIYRVGWNIPLPGIDPQKVERIVAQRQGGRPSIEDFLNIISGGGIHQASLFSLGIMPYISASIIFSLLVKVIPALERVAKEGSAGQRKINQWTRYATVPICLVQSVFAVQKYKAPAVQMAEGARAIPITFDLDPGFLWTVLAVLALTAGTVFLMWIGEQITEHGVGNGISILIMAGITARLPQSIYAAGLPLWQAAILVALFVLVVLGVVYVTKGQRKIPVQYAKITRGRRVYGGQRNYLPLRLNMAGVMPVIFASALLAFPPLLFKGLNLPRAETAFAHGHYLWAMCYIGLTFFFSFFWVALMFNPVEMSKNMKEYGSFIPGIRPGRPTAEHLEKILDRITLSGAAFLALIAILPVIVASLLKLPEILTYYLGGTTILIIVSVALDLVDKLNSYLVMRNYEGFLRAGGGRKEES